MSSLRDRWFDEFDRLELEPDFPAVPADMKSDAWWRAEKNGGRQTTSRSDSSPVGESDR
jgi:hypothetical protein